MGEWPVQQSEDVGLTLYEYIGRGDEGIDHCTSSPHRAATSSWTGSSCDGQTGSLLSSVSPPANLINTTSPALLTTLINVSLLLTVTGLTQWGICASQMEWRKGRAIQQGRRETGCLFLFLLCFSLQISVTEPSSFPRRNPIISLCKSGQSAHR